MQNSKTRSAATIILVGAAVSFHANAKMVFAQEEPPRIVEPTEPPSDEESQFCVLLGDVAPGRPRQQGTTLEDMLENPPNDEELTKAVLPRIRHDQSDDRTERYEAQSDAFGIVKGYLAVRREREAEFKASVWASMLELERQADRLRELQEQYVETREKIARHLLTTDDTGSARFSAFLEAALHQAGSELGSTGRHEWRLRVRHRHLERFSQLEQQAFQGLKSGSQSRLDYLRARAARLAAEISLHREQFPGTSPNWLEAHLTRVATLQERYNRLLAVEMYADPGVQTEYIAKAAVALARARAELELLRGDYAKALCYRRSAYVAGLRGDDAASASYETGSTTLGCLLGLKRDMHDARTDLFDLEQRYRGLDDGFMLFSDPDGQALPVPKQPVPKQPVLDQPEPSADWDDRRWGKPIADPPSDEKLTRQLLSVIRRGEPKDRAESRRFWAAIEAYLYASQESWAELEASLQASEWRPRDHSRQRAQFQGQYRRTCEEIDRRIPATGDVGSERFEMLIEATSDLAEAQLATTVRHEERLKICRDHLKRSTELKNQTIKGLQSGTHTEVDRLRAEAARLAAEIALHSQWQPDPRGQGLYLAQIEALQRTFNKTVVLRRIGAPGGETEKAAASAVALARARAELELARGDFAKAILFQRVVYVAGLKHVEAASAARDTGTLTLEDYLASERCKHEAWFTLFDIERRYGDPKLLGSADHSSGETNTPHRNDNVGGSREAPPTDAELTKAILRIGKVAHWSERNRVRDLLDTYLHDSAENAAELRASVLASIQRLERQGTRLETLKRLNRRTHEKLVRHLVATGDVGNPPFAASLDAASDLNEAKLAATVRHEDRLTILRDHLQQMKEVEKRASEGLESGRHTRVDHLRAVAARLAAEIVWCNEQYPGTLPRQLEAHLARVEALQIAYRKAVALRRVAMYDRPGWTLGVSTAAVALTRARAELELARGDYAKALLFQRAAYVASGQCAAAAYAAYESGTLALGDLLVHRQNLDDTRLTLLDLERRYGDPALIESIASPPVGHASP